MFIYRVIGAAARQGLAQWSTGIHAVVRGVRVPPSSSNSSRPGEQERESANLDGE